MLEAQRFEADVARLADAAPGQALCHASDLTFTIDGKTLVDHVNLTLADDTFTVIMGPNGAGKSLLVRLLHGLIPPTEGQILWAGEPMTPDIRKRQSMVFQRPVLLRRSVAANIDFVLRLRGRADKARRREILEMVGLADRERQQARLLSGGEQQRLALGRGLATDPEVLFLDEPTASLDPASVLMIEQIVTKAREERGVKIIFITHDMGQARRLAEDVIFMHRGKLVEHTPAERFFNEPVSRAARDYVAGRIVL
ncbi:ATP-binding cassette domain-containing protein [Dichotomicrobium thermohalophilum]|uniref:Phosphate ABC transporter ATP-binding protein (PhoT family) n=1 Tax=Dichotomicrobium thermohalophilum TaxID=933063 RepID=A0A397PN78_9HYPH|nr:ATP-binding cassette domain-containing protein [Dichotomicrobium thermohalophilum]RIA47201.1 phosphate ABC transporter ATP-binding protein (PhoT family) [Dichotomicrobium thermohalophilum]